jgi:hypothetical protein
VTGGVEVASGCFSWRVSFGDGSDGGVDVIARYRKTDIANAGARVVAEGVTLK